MKLEISPVCEKCNNPLTVSMQNYDTKKEVMRVYISPCKFCLNDENLKGYKDAMKHAGETVEKVLAGS